MPVRGSKQGTWCLDLERIDSLLGNAHLDMRPSATPTVSKRPVPKGEWVVRRLDQLFDLIRGDFHSLKGIGEW